MVIVFSYYVLPFLANTDEYINDLAATGRLRFITEIE